MPSLLQLQRPALDFIAEIMFAQALAPQIHARRLQAVKNLACAPVVNVAREQPCYDFRQSALHRSRIIERDGIEPSLPRMFRVFSGSPCRSKLMVVAVPRPPHSWRAAAGCVVLPMLA